MRFSYSPYVANGVLICTLLCTPQNASHAKPLRQPSPPQSAPDTSPTIPMLDEGKGLIHLDVSVTNSDGEPASGLNQEDFELLDEGRPQKILTFHAFNQQGTPSDPPVQIVLFLDTYKMSSVEASREQLSIEEFLKQNDGHLSQPVWIFGLSDDGFWTVAHHESTYGNSLASDLAFNSRVTLNRKPDALRALAFIATGQRRIRGRKVLLWVGPGCDKGTGIFPASQHSGHKTFDPVYWFTTVFREARLSIDAISVDAISVDQERPCTAEWQRYLGGVRMLKEADDRFLYKKVLAIQSGGDVIDESGDVVAQMNRCMQRALDFYTLSFDPAVAAQAHEYHSLQVRVHRPGLRTRTNAGYYNEPFYSDQPNPMVSHVTVTQLDQMLSPSPRSRPDSSFGNRGRDETVESLSKVELTERLSLSELSHWTSEFQNKNVQQALTAVADTSAFLEPPATEISTQAPPDEAARQLMLTLVKDYLEQAIPRLPDFYATRTTVRYEEMPQVEENNTGVDATRLQVAETSKARVLYRDGDEVVESRTSERDDSGDRHLKTHGTFGPLLAEVRRGLEVPGRMKWVRWETDPKGNRAVFEFEVPAAESRDFEGGCCLPDADGENPFRIQAGYRGEVAINPENGAILRLQLQFDLRDYVPMDRDEVLVEYGPVNIGGRAYVCPVRSVSIARGRSNISLKEWDQSFLSYGPYSTKMNDMRFSNYHMFRSESRILPGFTPEE